MSWSKRQFISHAFDEIGLSPFIFEPGTEQFTAALRRLDAMMATWNARGIRVGYPMPGTPESSNIDDRTGVPDIANEAIFLNLAVRIAPGYGKQVAPETKVAAKQAYDTLLMYAAQVKEQRLLSGLPSGAGNRNSPTFSYVPRDIFRSKQSQ